jgi:hypothetical protein
LKVYTLRTNQNVFMAREKSSGKVDTTIDFGSNDPQAESFAYQLDFLKLEYNAINELIKRIDEITQKNKEWAILIWAGSISVAISQTPLRKYIMLTAILPLLFWFIDAWWRRIQKTSVFRVKKISDFLNGPDLEESFRQKKLVNFHVVDPRGGKYSGLPEYESYKSAWRTMRYGEVGGFYLGLIVISLSLGGLFLWLRL